MVQLVSVASLLVLLAGCATCPVDPASTMICDGTSPFEALSEDAVVPVVFGAQGGFHLLLATRAHDIAPGSSSLERGYARDDLPVVTWDVHSPDERLTAEQPRRVVAERSDNGWVLGPHTVVLHYFESPPAAFDPIERQNELETLPITLSVEVEDACGNVATDEIDVSIDFPLP